MKKTKIFLTILLMSATWSLAWPQGWYYARPAAAGGGLTLIQALPGGSTSGDPSSVANVNGAGNYLYLLFVNIINTQSISSISGGGLTWNLQSGFPQTNGNNNTYLYVAQGTPSSNPFTVTIDLSASTACAATVAVISGHNTSTPLSDITIATGNSAAPSVITPTTNFAAGDWYIGFVGWRGSGNAHTPDANYNEQSSESNRSATNCVYQDNQAGTDNVPTGAITSNTWVAVGAVLNKM